MIKNFLNAEGHPNPISGSKVMVILLKGWIWAGAWCLVELQPGRVWVCACTSVTHPLVQISSKHCQSQTGIVRKLKFWENVHPTLCVMCNLSPVTSHQSPVTCHLSPLTCHLPHVNYHQSPSTCHLSPIACHLSSVTCHLTTTLCSFSCCESPRILADGDAGALGIKSIKQKCFF